MISSTVATNAIKCDVINPKFIRNKKLNNISQKSPAFTDYKLTDDEREDTWLALPSMAIAHSEKAKTAIFKMESTRS